MRLGTIEGAGTVKVKGEAVGPANYWLEVTEERSLTAGRGTLDAEAKVLQRIIAGRGAELFLSDGGSVKIILSQWDVINGTAQFETSGPIPGF